MLKYLSSMLLFFSLTAFAENVEARLGRQIEISVPKEGASIEFSEPVKAVSGGTKFRISAVGAEADDKTHQASNPRVFVVTPLVLPASEPATFVFSGSGSGPTSLQVVLSFKDGAPGYSQVHLNRQNAITEYKGFLSRESEMMAAMIRDDDAFGRKVVDSAISFPGIKDLRFKVARRFEADGFTGFTLLVTNDSGKTVTLAPSKLNIAKGEAILAQIDHEVLEPCSKNNSNLPSENSCTSALRILVRGNPKEMPQAFPFMKTHLGEAQQ